MGQQRHIDKSIVLELLAGDGLSLEEIIELILCLVDDWEIRAAVMANIRRFKEKVDKTKSSS